MEILYIARIEKAALESAQTDHTFLKNNTSCLTQIYKL